MLRFLFALSFLSGLFVLVPWMARATRGDGTPVDFVLASPGDVVDTERLRLHSRNRALAVASEDEVLPWRGATVGRLVTTLLRGTERERRVAGALLGASGHPDAVQPLIRAFRDADRRDDDPRTIAALATALAESQRTEALEALIEAIGRGHGLAAHEASRALQVVYGIQLGLDVAAWQTWLEKAAATRD